MNIIFAGTPEFALPALKKLLASKHTICAIYTQPDRPAGRGQKLTASPIKQFALTTNIPILQPTTLKDLSEQEKLRAFNADALVNVAYGMLLPKEVLEIPRYGCVNIHPSLLPRFRGAAPIQRAILAGDQETGVTIMQMDVGLDTGGIYAQKSIPITATDTTATIAEKTAALGADLLLAVLNNLENHQAKITPQNDALSTYAKKLTKEEGQIDWNKSAAEIDRMIRAFNPWPVAFTNIEQQTVRIFQAEVVNDEQYKIAAGTIFKSDDSGIDVTTGKGMLRLQVIQLPGGKQLPIAEILKSKAELFAPGAKFCCVR